MAQLSDLRSCPWCGAWEKSYLHVLSAQTLISYHERDHYYIRCLNCMAQGPAGNSEKEAIALWHTLQRDENKSYLHEFVDAISLISNTLNMDFFDFSASNEDKKKAPEITRLLKIYHQLEAKILTVPYTKEIENDADYICRSLSYFIDQGAFGEYSDNYPMFPVRWEKRPPLVPALLDILQKTIPHIDPSTSDAEKLLANINDTLSKYQEAQLNPKENK